MPRSVAASACASVMCAALTLVFTAAVRPPTSADASTLPQLGEHKIVFSSERDGNPEIYLMNEDGSGVTRLTENPADDALPYCSPDGSRIVFSSDRDGIKQLYLIDIDGGNLTRLTNNEFDNGSPSWSPDGSKIAFVADRDGNNEIYVMDADGANPTRVTRHEAEDTGPAWCSRQD